MSEVARLEGALTSTPTYAPGQQASISIPIAQWMTLRHSLSTTIELDNDNPVSVPFGALSVANVLMLRATGGNIRVRVTSPAGSTQATPAELFVLMSAGVNITAVDITRTAGVTTLVSVFLGERA
jgi:hypothetical protein